MAWSGYIALGNVSAGTFTELTNPGYGRLPFAFRAPLNGYVKGDGGGFSFPVVSGTPWVFNAYAFYEAQTGGTPDLVYPHPADETVPPGTAYLVSPSRVWIDYVNQVTVENLPLDTGQVAAITGLSSGVPLPANLPTVQPSTPGQWWNNGGVLCITT